MWDTSGRADEELGLVRCSIFVVAITHCIFATFDHKSTIFTQPFVASSSIA